MYLHNACRCRQIHSAARAASFTTSSVACLCEVDAGRIIHWPDRHQDLGFARRAIGVSIEPTHPHLSVARPCVLFGLARSSRYCQPVAADLLTRELLERLDEQYTRTSCYGVRRMTAHPRQESYRVKLERVRRLPRRRGLEAIDPKPQTSTAAPGHRRYPFLPRGSEYP